MKILELESRIWHSSGDSVKHNMLKRMRHIGYKTHIQNEKYYKFWGQTLTAGALEHPAMSSGKLNERVGRPGLIGFLECAAFGYLRYLRGRYGRVGCGEG